MKLLNLDNELPQKLSTCDPEYNKCLQKKAKRNIKFQNYKPIDTTLGAKGEDNVIIGERVEKEYDFKVEKTIRNMFDSEKNLLKIIPQKNTIDLARALSGRLQRLQLRTEVAIVEILKEKININETDSKENLNENGSEDKERGQEGNQEEQNGINDNQDKMFEEDLLQNGRNLKDFEGKKYECIKWIDTILEENENYDGDLLKQVELMERMNDLDLEKSEDFSDPE